MMTKRQKKIFPPGTFIPTKARICAIIQLCLAFTIILWNAALPFAGELFSFKSSLLLYQDVMGLSPLENTAPEMQKRLARNASRFQELAPLQKKALVDGLHNTQIQLQRSFVDKMQRSIQLLIYEMPPLQQAWLILSIILPILLLKRVEGMGQAIWLLPLLAALFALDNRWYGSPETPATESLLFPSENVLIEQYLKEPLSRDVFKQQEELKRGWKLYVVDRWSTETPSKRPEDFEQQVEKGEFAFNVARIKQRAEDHSLLSYRNRQRQEPLFALALYLFWNTFFAFTAWKALDYNAK